MGSNGHEQPRPLQPSLALRLSLDGTRLRLAGVDIHDMPGGWRTAHDLLLEAAKMAMREAVKAAQPGRVQVAQHLPGRGLQG